MRVMGTVLSKFHAELKGFDHNNNLLLLHNCVCKQKCNLRIQYKIKHKVNKKYGGATFNLRGSHPLFVGKYYLTGVNCRTARLIFPVVE